MHSTWEKNSSRQTIHPKSVSLMAHSFLLLKRAQQFRWISLCTIFQRFILKYFWLAYNFRFISFRKIGQRFRFLNVCAKQKASFSFVAKEFHKNRRMKARDFSRERKCAAIKDANTEHIQAEYIFFAFLPVFCQKVLSAKTFFWHMCHTDSVTIFRKETAAWT